MSTISTLRDVHIKGFFGDTYKYIEQFNIRHEDFHLFGLHPFVCHAQASPPEFCNGLDWRALVKSHIPNIGKLRG